MHKGLEGRIAALERGVNDHSRIVLLMLQGETEEQTLARHERPPGTDAMFIELVALERNDHE